MAKFNVGDKVTVSEEADDYFGYDASEATVVKVEGFDRQERELADELGILDPLFVTYEGGEEGPMVSAAHCTLVEAKPLSDSAARKAVPVASGCLDYFPAALQAVARLSKAGNDKHNPGQPMHHARGKSMDHADCLVRHLIDRGQIDPETGLSHTVAVAWRALAMLQEELEAQGAPLARGAKVDK